MELDFAILADAVQVKDGGKLDVQGAGIDTVSTTGDAPFEHSGLTLLSRVLVSDQELGKAHRLDVVLVGPDGDEIVQVDQETDPIEPHPNPERRTSVGFVMVMNRIPLPAFGNYEFRLLWDGSEVHKLPLFVEPIS